MYLVTFQLLNKLFCNQSILQENFEVFIHDWPNKTEKEVKLLVTNHLLLHYFVTKKFSAHGVICQKGLI